MADAPSNHISVGEEEPASPPSPPRMPGWVKASLVAMGIVIVVAVVVLVLQLAGVGEGHGPSLHGR